MLVLPPDTDTHNFVFINYARLQIEGLILLHQQWLIPLNVEYIAINQRLDCASSVDVKTAAGLESEPLHDFTPLQKVGSDQ